MGILAFFSAFVLLFAHMVCAVAVPNLSPRGCSTFDKSSRHPSLFERQAKCKREDEKVGIVTDAVNAVSGGSAVLAYSVANGVLAKSVCELIAPQRGGEQGKCNSFGQAIGSAVFVAFETVIFAKQGITVAARRSTNSLSASLSSYLIEAGWGYDMITSMPMTSGHIQQSETSLNTTRQPLGRVSITGMQQADGPIDVIVTTYDDGSGHIFASPTPTNTTGLAKRQDGPGFKVNYQAISSISGQAPSDEEISARLQLSQDIAQDWVDRANNKGMSEWIGTAKIDGIVEFGIRIIPEIKGFGENFESVNVCGPLKKNEL